MKDHMKICPACRKKYEQIYGKLKEKDGTVHLFPVCDDAEEKSVVK